MDSSVVGERIQHWLQTHPGVFHLQVEHGGVKLTEIGTAKSLRLDAEQVLEIETKQNWNTGSAYLVLTLESSPPLAISDAGFVFALETRNTGQLPSAPPTMSFRDFRRLLHHLEHLVAQQAAPGRRAEALDTAMILIASLDGARALGFATGSEEAELDQLIRKLEAGA